MRRQYHMAEVVYRHVAIDSLLRKLERHDSPCCILKQDIHPIRTISDCLRGVDEAVPVREIALVQEDGDEEQMLSTLELEGC